LIADGNGRYRCSRFGFTLASNRSVILCKCPDGKTLSQADIDSLRATAITATGDKRAIILAAVTERWADAPDIRTMPEIETLLDKYIPPCGCPDRVSEYVTFLLNRRMWYREWGPKPEANTQGA
jgi:hypothetical protein